MAPVRVTLQSKLSGISPFVLGMNDWRLQVKLQGVQHAICAAGCWLQDMTKRVILAVGCTQSMPCSLRILSSPNVGTLPTSLEISSADNGPLLMTFCYGTSHV